MVEKVENLYRSIELLCSSVFHKRNQIRSAVIGRKQYSSDTTSHRSSTEVQTVCICHCLSRSSLSDYCSLPLSLLPFFIYIIIRRAQNKYYIEYDVENILFTLKFLTTLFTDTCLELYAVCSSSVCSRILKVNK